MVYENKITVSGVILSQNIKTLDNGSVIVEAEILNEYRPEKGKPKDFRFTVSTWGDLGKKLRDLSVGTKIVVAGRMENFSGVRQDGTEWTGYYKIQAREINIVETDERKQQPVAQPSEAQNAWDDLPF